MWVNKCPFMLIPSVSLLVSKGLSAQRKAWPIGYRGTFNKSSWMVAVNDWKLVAKKLVLDWAEQCSSLQLYSQGERQPQTSACWWRENARDSLPGWEGGSGGGGGLGTAPTAFQPLVLQEGHNTLCQVWDELAFQPWLWGMQDPQSATVSCSLQLL